MSGSNRRNIAAAIGFLVLAIAVAIGWWLQPPQPQLSSDSAYEEQHGTYRAGGSHCEPAQLRLLSGGERQRTADACADAQEQSRQQTNGVVEARRSADAANASAIATYEQARIAAWGVPFVVVTMFAAIVAAIFAERAAHHTMRAANVAERALTDLETPFLYPVIIHNTVTNKLGIFKVPDNVTANPVRPEVTFIVKNFGRSAAIIRSIASSLDNWTQIPQEPRVDMYANFAPRPILEPREETDRATRKINLGIDIEAAKGIERGDTTIWFYGEVCFSDIFGSDYRQTFCFAYDSQKERFVPYFGTYNKRHRLTEPVAT